MSILSNKRLLALTSSVCATVISPLAYAQASSAPLGGAVAKPKSIGMPYDASTYGHEVDWLINFTIVCSVILFGVMCIWMLYAFIKHSRRANHVAEHDHGDAKKQAIKAMALSGLIFFVVDGTLWVDSTVDINNVFWNFEDVDEDPSTVKIEIQGRQWLWQARYSGPDGEFNTADDPLSDQIIWVPANRPVLLQLASPDVIHTFALPNFRLKQDAVPGMINMMWFEAKETGDFEIVCVQHCGVYHYQMRGILRVVDQDTYDQWIAQQSKFSEAVWASNDTEAHWGWTWRKR